MIRIRPLKNREKSQYSRYMKVYFKPIIVFNWWLCSEEKNFSCLQSNKNMLDKLIWEIVREMSVQLFAQVTLKLSSNSWIQWLQTQGPRRLKDSKPWKSQRRTEFLAHYFPEFWAKIFSKHRSLALEHGEKAFMGEKII